MTPTPLRIVIYALAAIIVLLLVFEIGIFAGFRKARLGYGPGDHGFFFLPSRAPHLLPESGYGAVGEITKIALPSLTIRSRDGAIRVVDISSSTLVRSRGADASTSALFSGENVAAIGLPGTGGSLNAKFIRIIPSAPPSALFRP